MVTFFRRFQKPLLLTLTILVIISFVIMYAGPGSRLQGLRGERVGTLHGRPISAAEYRSIARQFEVLRTLGMLDVIIPLTGNARSMQDAVDNYVWNTLVLRHASEHLGLLPTQDQIFQAVQRLPIFQNQGKFDYDRQAGFLNMYLRPRGFNEAQFEEMIADSVRLQSIRDSLAASSAPAPDELENAYRRQHQKIEAAIVRFSKAEVEKTVQISEEDLKKEFETRKDSLKTPEKRIVDYVLFPLPKVDKTDKDGPGAKRPEPEEIQKLVDRAADFAAALLEPNTKFADVAKKFEMEVKTSPSFTSGERLKELGNDPRVSAAAFQLSQEKSVSEALPCAEGYFVLHLHGIDASKPISFEESKEKLTTGLRNERTREALSLRANEARKKLEDQIKSGKSFAEAAKAAALKVETPEAFSRTEAKSLTGTNASLIQNNAADLKEGQTSSPLEASDETLLVHVLKRLPVDPADLEKQRPTLVPMLESQRTDALLMEWIERQRASALQSLVENR
jgi:peptidyl-prolyl cis-trans isomerase D